MKEAQQHQDVPFEILVNELGVPKDQSRHPIFQIMFSVQSFGKSTKSNLFKTIDIREYYKIAKFDLNIFIDDSKDKLECDINYATSLFKKETIQKISIHYQNILRAVSESADLIVSEIEMLSRSEYQQLVYEWNKTSSCSNRHTNATVQQLFETQVEKTPDRIAVTFENKKFTYSELNSRVNQLAATIRTEYKNFWDTEITKDTLIGIYFNRNIDMVTVILAILKTGAAYVPFDIADPEERLSFKINDSGCKMIITSSELTPDLLFLSQKDTIPLAIDSYCEVIKKASTVNLPVINSYDSLAYIIYTSGSTGKPKGVMIEQRSIINLVKNSNFINIYETDNIGCFASIVFDAATFELWGPLLNGASCNIVSKDCVLSEKNLEAEIVSKKINKSFVTTALFNQLAMQEKNPLYLMDDVFFGGEACNPILVKKFIAANIKTRLVHVYGPTETTTFSTFCELTEENIESCVPIGKGLSGYSLYVLNQKLQPVPIGVAGELFIGGHGIARGYLNRHQLTNERFINNPFIAEKETDNSFEQKIYRTGDIVKWLPDGNIEFIGRNDNQVKIRGFRIELGEIENKLSSHNKIENSVVVCIGNNNSKYLCGYYIAEKEIPKNELIDFLSDLLPDYMVPNHLIRMNEFPLTNNGKVEKRLLPEPDLNSSSSEYVPPRNGMDKIISEVWCKVLNLEKISIDESIFSLGASSLSVITFTNLMRKNYSFTIPAKYVFNLKNIKLLSDEISNNKSFFTISTSDNEIDLSLLKNKVITLSPDQYRYFMIKDKNPNMPVSFLLEIKDPRNFDLNKIVKNLKKVHLNLNTKITNGKVPCVKFDPDDNNITKILNYNLKTFDMEKITDICNDINGMLDCYKTTSIFADITIDSPGKKLFFVSILHLFSDMLSINIILDEVSSLIKGEQLTETDHRSYLKWLSNFKKYHNTEYTELTTLLKDNSDSSLINSQRNKVYEMVNYKKEMTLDSSLNLSKIKKDVIFVAAFSKAYRKVLDTKSIILPVNFLYTGRAHKDNELDLNNTVGLLSLFAPIRINLELSNDKDFKEKIKTSMQNANDNIFLHSFFTWDKKSSGETRDILQANEPKVLINFKEGFNLFPENMKYLQVQNTLKSDINQESAYLLNTSINWNNLTLDINYFYSTKLFSKEIIDEFHNELKKEIMEISLN